MFIFNRNTEFVTQIRTAPVKNAIKMLERDRDKVFGETTQAGGKVCLLKTEGMGAEQYRLEVNKEQIIIEASDDLGWVYGLLYLSEHYLGIKPFWFWMDQQIEQRDPLMIPPAVYIPPRPVVRFRGWFFNDEVLMMKWKYNENGVDGWQMAFEALLRCGGNMTIPGTDKMSRKNRKMASDMGLWITHHHAEPLGAEMFVRAYPDREANYMESPELFHQLWEDAVREQKDKKVVWNLCFRGQGDAPFWSFDTTGQFDTPEKRGRLISSLIRKQCDIVKKYVEHPVFCTNLYGEIMELYEQGYIDLDEDIIKVRADNGFGKMVTRRRDDHNPRVSSMPDPEDKTAGGNCAPQGIYYHVSFYDLQAANHITMLPNSVSFVDRELGQVLENGGDDFWVINCSNVRPHTYFLDAVRKKWMGRTIDDKIQSREFVQDYFHGKNDLHGKEGIAACYENYPKVMIPFGSNEDEHMGEQFYTENVRIMAHQILVDSKISAPGLVWIAGKKGLKNQIEHVCGLCRNGLDGLQSLYEQCKAAEQNLQQQYMAEGTDARLFGATLMLQSLIHYHCARGVVLFGQAFEALEQGEYAKAFVLFGNSAECFDEANDRMRASEYGVWEDFYLNDCFADIKHTAYMIRKVMGYVRELGDNARHDKWYREYCYAKEDQKVFLLLVTDNHMTDWELYQVMKSR